MTTCRRSSWADHSTFWVGRKDYSPPVRGHGRRVPTGRAAYRPVLKLLRQMAGEIYRAAESSNFERAPDLQPWVKRLASALEPVLARYLEDGYRKTQRQLEAATKKSLLSLGVALVSKAAELAKKVAAAVVLATADKVTRALERIREEWDLRTEKPGALAEFKGWLDDTIAGAKRAAGIAGSSSVDGYNVGVLEAAKDSEQDVRFKWLATAGACDFCRRVNGTVRKAGESFGRNGDYEVYAPTAHPHCRCFLLAVPA